MNYICAAEFLKQPDEVRKVLRDWIKDKYVKGDLVATYHGLLEIVIILESFSDENGRKGYYCITQHKKTPMWVAEYPEWITPLFNETQLRNFIEEKLNGCNIYFESYTNGDTELTVEFEYNRSLEGDCDVGDIKVICEDMLDGYWKIACQIALEDI